MSHPPHLPHQSCSLTLHNLFHHVRNVVFFVALSIFAGMTGALIVTAWIEPTFYGQDNIFLINRNAGNITNQYISQDFPHPQVTQRINNITMRLYDKTQEVDDTAFYSDAALLGQAVMISSDGWAVTYMPHTRDMLDHAIAYDHQGVAYDVDTVIPDPVTDFVYIKFVGENFRVISFADVDQLMSGSDVWAVDVYGMHKHIIGSVDRKTASVYNALKPSMTYTLTPHITQTSLVVNDQGQFMGFADTDNVLHIGSSVTHHVESLLAHNRIENPSFTILGYMVNKRDVNETTNDAVAGFLVTSVQGAPALSSGDIILRINGLLISNDILSQQLYQNNQPITATVLRNGEEVDIMVVGNT